MGVHAHDRHDVERAPEARRRRRAAAGAEIGQGFFGASAALSSDATTAVVGAPIDNSAVGAAYAFARLGRHVDAARQAHRPRREPTPSSARRCSAAHLALSTDATTLLVSGQADNNLAGAVWSYVATTPPAVSGVAPAVGTGARRHGGRDPAAAALPPTGIDAVASVTFAGVPATSFHVVSPTQIDAVAPPHGAGVADVDRDRAAGSVADRRRRPVPLRRRPGRPDEGRRDGRQPPGHGHLQAASRPPGPSPTGSSRRRAAPRPPAKQSPITVRGLRNGTRYRFRVFATNARRHEPLLAADARGHALRAAAAVARVDPGHGAERSAHRLHRDRRPALAQARLGRREHCRAGCASMRAGSPGTCSSAAARRVGRSRFKHGVLTIRLKRPARRIAVTDRRARALGDGVVGQSGPAAACGPADASR